MLWRNNWNLFCKAKETFCGLVGAVECLVTMVTVLYHILAALTKYLLETT